MNDVDLSVYGLVDPQRSRGRDLVELAEQAVIGGATILQYRDKHSSTRELIRMTRRLRDALCLSGVPGGARRPPSILVCWAY